MTKKQRFINTLFQYAQFNIIAIGNGTVDLVSLNLLLFFWPTDQSGLLLIFNSISYVLAVTNSYIWNSRLTFRQHSEKGHRQKIYFVIQAGVAFVISNLVFLLAMKGLTWLPLSSFLENNIAKGASMFVSSNASFVFMKWFVFRRKEDVA